jgi:acetyl-CoA carboxylase carboxyltransferase component
MDKKSSLTELTEKTKSVLLSGGTEQIDRQHKLKKLTARERVDLILDQASFVELDKYIERSQATPGFESKTSAGEGVITGYGTVDGRPVYVFIQDYTVLSGSMSMAQAEKITKIMDMALKNGSPVIGVLDSGGSRVAEGAAALAAYGKVVKKLNDLSGVVPTIAVTAGPCIGAQAYIACLTDFTISVSGISSVMLHGEQILSSAMGQKFDAEALGGAMAQNETQAYATVRALLSYLPMNNLDDAPYEASGDDVNRQIPELDAQEAFSAQEIIAKIADDGVFLEYHAYYAPEIITGLARVNGNTVGIVANAAGSAISAQAAKKAARFIGILDAYHLPVVTLVDADDIPVDIETKEPGLISALSSLMYAYAQTSAPMVTVIAGRAVAAGLLAMGTKSSGADVVLAWSNAEISALPIEAGSLIFYEKEINAAADPMAAKADALEKYKNEYASAFNAAKQGVVDDVIAPSATRQMIAAALEACLLKRENMAYCLYKEGSL